MASNDRPFAVRPVTRGAPGPGTPAGGRAPPPGRWFLACWPDPRTRRALLAQQAAWAWPPGARPTPAADLHLTLHFIGPLPPAALVALRRALDGLAPAEPMHWTLSRAEVWRGGVAVLLPAEVPPAALALHAAIAGALRVQGLPVEARPWRPHVTLARRARAALVPQAPESVAWTTTGFELVCSDRGYRRIARWPPRPPDRSPGRRGG